MRMLYLAPVDWHSIRQRPQQLAKRLAQRFELTYVDGVGLRSVRLSDAARIWRRAIPPRDANAPLPVIRPRYLPVVGNRFVDRLNRHRLIAQLRREFNFDDDCLLWLSTPSLLAQALLDEFSPRVVVYDCMDYYAAFHSGATRRRIEREEAAIVARADIVFCSSRGLAQRLAGSSGRIRLVFNGVEFEHFAIDRREMPAWRKRTTGPVVGCYGSLGDWLDYELLAELATRRPQWSFVFVGPKASSRFDRLLDLPNVRHLGVIDYADLPRQAIWFDIGLIPFKINELTCRVHPIKALEYLALGLPTVSARMPDLAEFAETIRFASTADEWLVQIERALLGESRSDEAIRPRRAAAAPHDWDARAATVVAEIDELLARAATIGPARKR